MCRLQPALIDAPMCGAYCCAGAPLAGAGLEPRVNEYGQQLCELCGARLNRVKHHRAHGAGRACHPQCKPSKHAVDSAALVPAVAVRSHKRGPTDPGKQQPAPAVLIASPPLLTPAKATLTRLHDRDSWMEQGWKMMRGNRSRVTMMKDWHRLVTASLDGGFDQWREMRAQFFEQNMRQSLRCLLLEQQRVRVVSRAEMIARGCCTRSELMSLF